MNALTNSADEQLYKQVILEHNKRPKNFGKLDEPSHRGEGYNPLCGDHIYVDLCLDGDQISKIGFWGDGCAICKASISILSTQLPGKSISEVEELANNYIDLLKGNLKENNESEIKSRFGKLVVFSNLFRFPARVKCAALGPHTVRAALGNPVDSASLASNEKQIDPGARVSTE